MFINSGMKKFFPLFLLMGLAACGAQPAPVSVTPDGPEIVESTDEVTPDEVTSYSAKFGETVAFQTDGSTLTVSQKPCSPDEDDYLEGYSKFIKVTVTFVNNSKKPFDSSLSTSGLTAGEVEGKPAYFADSPSNLILPGKKLTWSEVFGVKSTTSLQYQVSLGGFDGYVPVVFTS